MSTRAVLGSVVAASASLSCIVEFHAPGEGAAPKIRISRQTTFVTKPVGKDGYIDYVAAVNARLSKGVTPKNNAAVLLAQAIGPKITSEPLRKAYFAKLGIAIPPKERDYFVTMSEFATWKAGKDADAYLTDLTEQHDVGVDKPWSRKHLSKLSAWIDRNEEPLELVLKAAQRRRCYVPIVFAKADEKRPPVLFGQYSFSANRFRSLCRSLWCRAMLALHEGRPADAQRDLLASHKLARFVAQGFSWIDLSCGCALDSITFQIDFVLLRSGKLTDKQLQRYQQALVQLPELPTLAETVNFGDRVSTLDIITSASRRGLTGIEPFVDMTPIKTATEKRSLATVLSGVDWNAVLMRVNREYDKMVAALRHARHVDRQKAIANYEKQTPKPVTLKDVLAAGTLSRKRGTEMFARFLITDMVYSLEGGDSSHDRATTRHRLAILAVALERHRKAHGRFPAKLADLSPRFLKNVPDDLFTEKPFVYKPTKTGYLLYSVGPNGKDDGGKELGSGNNADDIPVRMTVKP